MWTQMGMELIPFHEICRSPCTRPLRDREKRGDVRPTLMLISASNSKNEVNKFNVSAIVVREWEESGGASASGRCRQKCCDERTNGDRIGHPSADLAVAQADEKFSQTKTESSSSSLKRERGQKLQCLPIFFGPCPVILLFHTRSGSVRI